MKKILTSVMIALMAITLFSACKKDDDSTGNDVMSAKNVINSIPDIASVKAVMDDSAIEDELVIATTLYQNNGFKLSLKTPPATCLYEARYSFDSEYDVIISDPNAKMGFVWANAFDNKDEEIGDFYYWGMNTRTYVEANYVYADRNFTVKGKIEDDEYDYFEEFNCSLKKGWNIIYWIEKEDCCLISTQKPSDITMEWAFEGYFCKSNQHQNLFKMCENMKARMQKTFNR